MINVKAPKMEKYQGELSKFDVVALNINDPV